jgi:hypothetical protein
MINIVWANTVTIGEETSMCELHQGAAVTQLSPGCVYDSEPAEVSSTTDLWKIMRLIPAWKKRSNGSANKKEGP